MNHKLLSHLAITAVVCLAYPGIASACTCAGHSTSFAMSADDLNVIATATMSLSADCEGTVIANITAPDNTEAGASNYVEGEVSATATKAIGTLDGTYSGVGSYFWDNIPGGGVGSGSYPSIPAQQNVPKFIQVYNSSQSEMSIARAGGYSTFTGYVKLSDNCSGSFSMRTDSYPPAGFRGGVCFPTQSCPTYAQFQVSNTVTQQGGGTSFTFGIVSDPNNDVGGGNLVVTATATLATKPPDCEEKTATSNSKLFTIN